MIKHCQFEKCEKVFKAKANAKYCEEHRVVMKKLWEQRTNKLYGQKHKNEIARYSKRWRKRNRLHLNAYNKQWRARNFLHKYGAMCFNARRNNLTVTLTFEEFKVLRLLPCHYCGGELPSLGSGMDRIDSSKGYSKENCLPCCSACNRAKSDLTTTEFKAHIRRIYEHWGSK